MSDTTTIKRGYCDDIEEATIANNDFRRVLYTGEHLQLVLMSLAPGEEIGEETHEDRDQFFRFEEGEGVVVIDGVENKVADDFAVIVPAGACHNVKNTGEEPLQFYSIYGPPEHKDKVVHKTKAQAEADHDNDEWNGETTE
ncbi:cupin domain-containing protein [Sphingomonas humi]|uniref:Cupin domain-containing protein n=1 Tax=Sphingomonas humi TaxID=335630 RepID=A0ABP7RU52_9SPHN